MLGEPHLKCHLVQRKFNKLQFHQGELRMDGAEDGHILPSEVVSHPVAIGKNLRR